MRGWEGERIHDESSSRKGRKGRKGTEESSEGSTKPHLAHRQHPHAAAATGTAAARSRQGRRPQPAAAEAARSVARHRGPAQPRPGEERRRLDVEPAAGGARLGVDGEAVHGRSRPQAPVHPRDTRPPGRLVRRHPAARAEAAFVPPPVVPAHPLRRAPRDRFLHVQVRHRSVRVLGDGSHGQGGRRHRVPSVPPRGATRTTRASASGAVVVGVVTVVPAGGGGV